jgi:hypothetical protein
MVTSVPECFSPSFQFNGVMYDYGIVNRPEEDSQNVDPSLAEAHK